MPRKRCCGLIDEIPVSQEFIPTKTRGKEKLSLTFEEVEALKLKDIRGLEQAECAYLMGLSRPTFQRILQSARKKSAEALVNGHTIIIEGGNYQVKNRVFECVECKHVWEEPPCTAGGKHGYEIACPKCGSMKKTKIDAGIRHACSGGEHGHGSGGCCHNE